MLDVAGQLTAAYEELVTEDHPDVDRVQHVVQLALRILGNTSAQFSQERRMKAISRLNPDLKSLVEEEDFLKAAPLLFGAGFQRKAMERSEQSNAYERPFMPPRRGTAALDFFF